MANNTTKITHMPIHRACVLFALADYGTCKFKTVAEIVAILDRRYIPFFYNDLYKLYEEGLIKPELIDGKHGRWAITPNGSEQAALLRGFVMNPI